jgi:hypothetical protein
LLRPDTAPRRLLDVVGLHDLVPICEHLDDAMAGSGPTWFCEPCRLA